MTERSWVQSQLPQSLFDFLRTSFVTWLSSWAVVEAQVVACQATDREVPSSNLHWELVLSLFLSDGSALSTARMKSCYTANFFPLFL